MPISATDIAHVWHPFQHALTYKTRQLIVTRAEGPYIFDHHGNRYLDGISGLWNVCLGYSERRVTDAMHKQATTMPFTSLIVFSHEPAAILADSLGRIAPPGLDTVFLTSGGSEAIETAIKLVRHVNVARGLPTKQRIISLHGGYHGMSYGALSVTGFAVDRAPFILEAPGSTQAASAYTALLEGRNIDAAEQLKNVSSLIRILDPSTIAAMIVEPVMGVAGMISQPEQFLTELVDLCKANGIFLILDEVATGFGRTGKMLAAEHANLRPDIIVAGKGITAGYSPLGALLIDRAIFDICNRGPVEHAFMHGFAYGGHPVSCAAALATIQVIEEDRLCEKVAKDGINLAEMLRQSLPSSVTSDIRQTGLMLSFDLLDPATGHFAHASKGMAVIGEARQRGVILRTTYGGFTLNIAPPYVCTHNDIEMLAEVTADAVKAAMWP